MPWRELSHSNEAYVRVSVEPRRNLVRLTRSALHLPEGKTLELVSSFVNEMESVLPRRERAQQRLLFDSREAPKMVDSKLESEVAGLFNQLMTDFGRLAVLIKTPIGVLQVRRLSRTNSLSSEVFFDEAEAISYLTKSG